MESKGTLFPKNQPMRMYSSLWNAEDWISHLKSLIIFPWPLIKFHDRPSGPHRVV
ncbi:unnamed protein product [Brassica oleracea var. botrytis]